MRLKIFMLGITLAMSPPEEECPPWETEIYDGNGVYSYRDTIYGTNFMGVIQVFTCPD